MSSPEQTSDPSGITTLILPAPSKTSHAPGLLGVTQSLLGTTSKTSRVEASLSDTLLPHGLPFNAHSRPNRFQRGDSPTGCDRLGITTPNAVQAFGALLVLDKGTNEDKLHVSRASENTAEIIGITPENLFTLECFTNILPDEQADIIWDAIDHIDTIEGQSEPQTIELWGWCEPRMLWPTETDITPRELRRWDCWCTIHRLPVPHFRSKRGSKFIFELEMIHDTIHPPSSISPDHPIAESGPKDPETPLFPPADSTATQPHSANPPLRRVRRQRRRHGVPLGEKPVNIFNIMARITSKLGSVTTMDALLDNVVGMITDIIRFHRILVYRFDEAHNGRVVAERVDVDSGLDSYLGLQFPASDIPAQARKLYSITDIRFLYDATASTSSIIAKNVHDAHKPLDLTFCYLRAMSPIHNKYLRNMGVRSSLSISIMAFGRLWGLVICHCAGPAPMRVPLPVRQALRHLGQMFRCNLERITYAERMVKRIGLDKLSLTRHETGLIVEDTEALLELFEADGVIMVIDNKAHVSGMDDYHKEMALIVRYLRRARFTRIHTTQSISEDLPDLVLPMSRPEQDRKVAGLMYIPLMQEGSPTWNIDFVVFLRLSKLQEVRWAGKPEKWDGGLKTRQVSRSPPAVPRLSASRRKLSEDHLGTRAAAAAEDIVEVEKAMKTLEPRKSFKVWTEVVTDRSVMWTEEHIETGKMLAVVYGKLTDIWRLGRVEDRIKMTPLMSLLMSNANHEVRTPLNHMINSLELAAGSSKLSRDTHKMLRLHIEVSKDLVLQIHNLLELTKLSSEPLQSR